MSGNDARGSARSGLSVVVCTRDRAARLARTLGSYERLTYGGVWELIVVVNASTDGTLQLVERFQATTALTRVVVVEEPRAGVCAARNAGWRAARGAIVAFVDDDCYPMEDFLTALDAAFQAPSIGFAGGRMLLFDDGDLPFLSIQTDERRRDLPARSVIRAGLIHGGNMAFRREVLEAIGGFDERLGAGTPAMSGGDVDALSRASATGHVGIYEPRIAVHHHHGRKTGEEGRSVMSAYDVGRGAFFVKCLLDPRRRGLYAVPILKRLAGHLIRRRFGVFRGELRGALIYLRSVFSSS